MLANRGSFSSKRVSGIDILGIGFSAAFGLLALSSLIQLFTEWSALDFVFIQFVVGG